MLTKGTEERVKKTSAHLNAKSEFQMHILGSLNFHPSARSHLFSVSSRSDFQFRTIISIAHCANTMSKVFCCCSFFSCHLTKRLQSRSERIIQNGKRMIITSLFAVKQANTLKSKWLFLWNAKMNMKSTQLTSAHFIVIEEMGVKQRVIKIIWN